MYGGRSGRAKGKQSQPKKNKNRCGLCHEKGHFETDCPTATAADIAAWNLRAKSNSGGAGSGISHKTSRKAKTLDEPNSNEGAPALILPEGFFPLSEVTAAQCEDEPYLYFDAGCDVGDTLDYISSLSRRKTKASNQYQKELAASAFHYGGCICRQLIKPTKPWKVDAPRRSSMVEADKRIWFAIGLASGFVQDEEDDDDEEAVDALVDAILADQSVVAVYCKLDYSPEILEFPGQDCESQLWRLRATCKAAIQENVPIQIRVDGMTNDDSSVIRDMAKTLVEQQQQTEQQLKIHLVSWAGKCDVMIKLLQAFPDTLYVGMNGTVGFAKSSDAHECAFDVPLNRLLLETDAPLAIPTQVNNSMGKTAFCHPGLVPFVAAAIADLKKTLSADAVARVASENTVALYGRGVAERAADAADVFAEALGGLPEIEQDAAEEGGESIKEQQFETKQERKKKKKKKKGGAAQGNDNGDQGGDVDAEGAFDEDFF
jgi:Tat protein secretion system quality control protein TatD with DNase activity